MKAYFEGILERSVLGVPTCSECKNASKTAPFRGNTPGTPEEKVRCSTCSQTKGPVCRQRTFLSGTPGTHSNFIGVLAEGRVTAASHTEHLGTPQIDNIQYYYAERAAILEYDGDLTKEEAELLAFKEGLAEYVNEMYPAIQQEYRLIISPLFGGEDDPAK